MAKVMRCAQCRVDLPKGASQDWGYVYGQLRFCSYGCMRTKQRAIEERLAQAREEKAKKKAAKAKEDTPMENTTNETQELREQLKAMTQLNEDIKREVERLNAVNIDLTLRLEQGKEDKRKLISTIRMMAEMLEA